METIDLSGTERGVYDFLEQRDIKFRRLEHTAAFTMEECREVERQLGAPVCKNLFLCNRQQTEFYMLMMPADKPFKTKYLSSQLGCARLSFASEENMRHFLRIAPGAVSAMGLIYDTGRHVRLIIDNEMKEWTTVGCHPCVNTASVALDMSDFLEKYLPATGHAPTFVSLPRETASPGEGG